MAEYYDVPSAFQIYVQDQGLTFWGSPSNSKPRDPKLSPGRYTVTEIYYDNNGTTWYHLDATKDGVTVWVPANNYGYEFPTADDEATNNALFGSDEYKEYLREQLGLIQEETETAVAEAATDSTTAESQLAASGYGSATLFKVYEDAIVGSGGEFDYYIEKTRVAFGMPPQWTKYVDPRMRITESMTVGRLYSRTIFTNPTILSLTPGDLKFVTDNDDLMDALMGGDENSIGSAISSMASGSSTESFFKFQEKWSDYISYVDELNKFLLIAMSTNDVKQSSDVVPMKDRRPPAGMFGHGAGVATSYKDIHLDDVIGQGLFGGVLQKQWVNFVVSGDVSARDDFSTSDRATTIESLVNSNVSDIIRDASFMLGMDPASESTGLIRSDIQAAISEATSTLGSGLKGLIEAATDILQGGRISFPHVIDDCTYGKTMSVPLRFVSPYGDNESRYLNILLPYVLLLGFTLPRQLKNKYDMYTYPFCVKASCRGIFACELGIIGRMDVVRGGNDNTEWTSDGQPTAMDVNLEIIPLHSKLMMSENDILMIKNLGMQHYLGSICGVELTLPTSDLIKQTWEALKGGESGLIYSMLRNSARHLITGISNWTPLSFLRDTGILEDLFP